MSGGNMYSTILHHVSRKYTRLSSHFVLEGYPQLLDDIIERDTAFPRLCLATK